MVRRHQNNELSTPDSRLDSDSDSSKNASNANNFSNNLNYKILKTLKVNILKEHLR